MPFLAASQYITKLMGFYLPLRYIGFGLFFNLLVYV
jgi:hypothetical protein